MVALSTDKAAAPINLYGATKLCSDKLFVAANNIKGSRDIRFSVVRYGNVMGSRGSVIPFFLERRKSGVLPITDPRDDALQHHAAGGRRHGAVVDRERMGRRDLRAEDPVLPHHRRGARPSRPNAEHEIVGIRPGEKLHEEMITASDSFNTVDLGRYYAILPGRRAPTRSRTTARPAAAKPVAPGFAYDSGSNPDFLGVDAAAPADPHACRPRWPRRSH